MRGTSLQDSLGPMIARSADLPIDPATRLRPKLLATSDVRLAMPLLGAVASPADHAENHNFISQWSSNHRRDAHPCGIMTLRNMNDVIVALFFFSLRTEAVIHRLLHVSRL